MPECANELYKDCSTLETIQKIKGILNSLHINMQEDLMQGIDGIYSVRLVISELNMGTNGKGLYEEAARASAYAELMERLQNFALYKFSHTIIKSENLPFYYYPNEVEMPYSMLDSLSAAFQNSYQCTREDVLFLHTDYEQNRGIFFSLPYRNYLNKETVYIPGKLTEHIYATNGMAAGNTLEEAMVQGISEVMERYANRIICEGLIVPPVIPMECLNFNQSVLSILHSLDEKNFSIEFRDCSLSLGLPVIALYFIDKNTGKYFVKFGAHPIISIAAERTLTELFQGRKFIMSSFWLKNFSAENAAKSENNFNTIFRSGDGVYPYQIFGDCYSYEYQDVWFHGNYNSNKDLLEYMLDIIRNNNWNIYIYDTSFLGFPTVHIIIPEISTINIIDQNYIKRFRKFYRIKYLIRDINSCNDEDYAEILDFIDSNNYGVLDHIGPMFDLPLNKNSMILDINVMYFKSILYLKLKRYLEAIQALDRYIEHNKGNAATNKFRCLRDLIYALYGNNCTFAEIRPILLKFYNPTIVNDAINIMKNNVKQVLNLQLDCYTCNNCNLSNDCNYNNIVEFHKKICSHIMKQGDRLCIQ